MENALCFHLENNRASIWFRLLPPAENSCDIRRVRDPYKVDPEAVCFASGAELADQLDKSVNQTEKDNC